MENIKFIDISKLQEEAFGNLKNIIGLDSQNEVIKAEKQDSYSKDEIDDLLKDAEISADKLQNKIKINSASTDYVVTQPTVSGDSLVITDSMSDKNQYHTFGYDKTITTTSHKLLDYSTPLFRGSNEYNCPQWDGNSIRFTYSSGINFMTRLTIPYTYNGVKYVTHFDIDMRSQMYKLNFDVINDANFAGYQAVKFKESEVYKAFGANGTFVFKTSGIIKDYGSPSYDSTSDFVFPGNNIEMSIGNFPLSNGALIIETPRFYLSSNNVLMGDVPTEKESYDYPEHLSDYIRYSNDVKAYILTDKNTTFKTINGEQITGNGNIEISTDVDLSNLATKEELNTKQDKLVSGTNIKSINGTSLLSSGNMELATKEELNAKQDVISDLETIRSGAAKGETALQSVPSEYATEQWVNSQGFLKEHQDISNLATKAELATKQDVISDLDSIRSGAALGATALQSVPDTYATEQWVNSQGFLKEHQDISNLATKSELATKQDTLVSGSNIKTVNGTSLLGSGNIEVAANVDLSDYYTKSQTNALVNPKLSQVTLTQAEYNALSTKEENVLYIISDAEDLKFKTINGEQITGEGNITIDTDVDLSGYATKSELNTKQNIISDLDSIRSGAAKGATALQSVPDTYALKSEIPDITTKQDKLVSGTNIKTVNGTSLLGSGNIVIEASSENVPTVQTDVQGTTNNYIYSSGKNNSYGVISDIGNMITYNTDNVSIKNIIYYWGSISSGEYRTWKINGATTSEAGLMSSSDKSKLDGIDTSIYATKTELATKQDTISDLETIRSGASKGATALQSVPSTYALKTDIPDITTKQDVLVSGTNIKTVNGISLLGEGNITVSGADLSDYYTKAEIDSMIGGASSTITEINNLVV